MHDTTILLDWRADVFGRRLLAEARMNVDRIALAVVVIAGLGFAAWQHGAHAAASGASVAGVTGAIDARGNATVWVFGSDRTIRVCSALIPATADQKPTCTKSAALP